MPHGLGLQFGKLLVIVGVAIAGAGIALMAGSRMHFLGHLPGDFSWHGRSGSIYFPIATCLIASAALTLILWAVSVLLKR